MKQYYDENKQDKKMVRLAQERNVTISPATTAARAIAKQFGLNRGTAVRIRGILNNRPNLVGEIKENISLIFAEMEEQGYQIEASKEFIRRYSDVLAQCNLGLTTKIEKLKSCGLERFAFASAQNLLYRNVEINEKALAVISEAVKAEGLTDEEIPSYFAAHTEMLGQNSIELRRVFAVLHRHNLLSDALFNDSRLLGLKADPSLINALIQSAKESKMLPTAQNLTEYYRSLDMKQKEVLRATYPFELREKMVVDYFYNDFVGETKAPVFARTRER